jgi:hypothetical protein
LPAQGRAVEEKGEVIEDVTAQDAALLVESEIPTLEGLP